MHEDGQMLCHVEIKGSPELILDRLEAVHGEQIDSSFYGSREFMLRAKSWQGGGTMSCTKFGDAVLICRE
jgi:hypothetical protein